MVWARTRLMIYDYVFEPVKQIKIDFVCRRTDLFYKKIQELLRVVFNIPEGYIQEKEYRWEKHKDTEQFEVSWEVTKIFDIYSYLGLEIGLRGFLTQDGEGRASVTIKSRLITEYPQDTIWQQSIFYEMLRRFWHRMYYHNKRMRFLYWCKEAVLDFERKLKEFSEEIKASK